MAPGLTAIDAAENHGKLMTKDLSQTVFELLCGNAESGATIDLAYAELHPTFKQAKTLLTLMNGRGFLVLRNEGYNAIEISELRLSGCKWASDQPSTPPPDGLDFS
jgi:hypothetical protein